MSRVNYINAERKGVAEKMAGVGGALRFDVVEVACRYDWDDIQNERRTYVEEFDDCFHEDVSDALLFVGNARPCYIRQGRWIGRGTDSGGIIPCTGYSKYVPLSREQKDQEFPIIAKGFSAFFIHCKYLVKAGDDFDLKCKKMDLFQRYFSVCWTEYKESHGTLKYRNKPIEAEFIKEHLKQERQYLKECNLDNYPTLKLYAEIFGEEYIGLLNSTQQALAGEQVRPIAETNLEYKVNLERDTINVISSMFYNLDIEDDFNLSFTDFVNCVEYANFKRMLREKSLPNVVCYVIYYIYINILNDRSWYDNAATGVMIKDRDLQQTQSYISKIYNKIKNMPKYQNKRKNNT